MITGCTTHPYADVIHVRFPSVVPKCPRCGSEYCHVKNCPKPQTVHHTPHNGRPTFISGGKPRYACCHCRKTFYATPELLHPALHIVYCAFTNNHKCPLWTDYDVTRLELEELHELCHGNWIEIERLRKWTDALTCILDEHGIRYPQEWDFDNRTCEYNEE